MILKISSQDIGHKGEMHFVSTCPVSPLENSADIERKKSGEHIHLSPKSKRKNRAAHMKEYRKATDSLEKRAKLNENKRKCRAALNTPEKIAKHNADVRSSQAALISPERKAKCNAYDRHHAAVLKDTNTSVDVSVKKFHDIVKQGPVYICSCCDQLWYKHSVVNACKLRESQLDSAKYLCNKISVDDKEWICRTCNNHLVKNKLPPCAIANGMGFPMKPEFFDLNELECRLLAPRIAFQKLMQAPQGRQLKIHGNIVNVPADVAHTVTMLPQLHSQTATIKVNLKHKLQYKSSALSLNVRPDKVVQVAK